MRRNEGCADMRWPVVATPGASRQALAAVCQVRSHAFPEWRGLCVASGCACAANRRAAVGALQVVGP